MKRLEIAVLEEEVESISRGIYHLLSGGDPPGPNPNMLDCGRQMMTGPIKDMGREFERYPESPMVENCPNYGQMEVGSLNVPLGQEDYMNPRIPEPVLEISTRLDFSGHDNSLPHINTDYSVRSGVEGVKRSVGLNRTATNLGLSHYDEFDDEPLDYGSGVFDIFKK